MKTKRMNKWGGRMSIGVSLLLGLAALPGRLWGQAGSVDFGFVPGTEQFGQAWAFAPEPGGAVLAAGFFGSFQAGTERGLIRLTGAGTLDAGFNPPVGWGDVLGLARQADGKILIGGFFSELGTGSMLGNRIARLNPDGSVDASFNAGAGVEDNFVQAIAVQANGQILIAGAFQSVAGVARTNLARLNANGSLDVTFNPPPTLSGRVEAVAIQPDGKTLVGGFISAFRGVARLNANGSRDATFVPAIDASASVAALALQTDGKIVLGGNVPVGGVNRGVVRLNPNGSIDATFNPGTGLAGVTNAVVSTLALQADGKILVGGFFHRFNGVGADHLVRLNADGTLDVNYDPGTFNDTAEPTGNFGSIPVQALAVQADGKTVVAGSFVSLAGSERNGIVRLLGGENPGYAGRLHFGATRSFISETGGLANIIVTRTRSSNGVATVDFTASTGARVDLNDLPATPGLDFSAQTGSLTLTQGQTSVSFIVPILDDNLGESMESIALVLSRPGSGAVLGRPGVAGLSILENDSAFESFVFSDDEMVGEHAGEVRVSVSRRGVLNGTATVQVATGGGTATAGADYTAQNATLTFASGQAFQNISIPINDDRLTEGNETFIVSLRNPSPGVFLNPHSNLVVTIVDNDDDGPGTLVGDFAPTFGESFFPDAVDRLALGPGGDVFAAGTFTQVNGVFRQRLARLRADGSLHPGFNPQRALAGNITAFAVEPDGRVLVGTYMETNFDFRHVLLRLQADGSLDGGFNVGSIVNGTVNVLARDASGRWLVGGTFPEIGGAPRDGLARLFADGTVDASFDPRLEVAPQPFTSSPAVSLLATQANGRIVIVGNFTSVNGVSRPTIARLNADGSLDESFDAQGLSGLGIRAFAAQASGKWVLVVSSYDGFREGDSRLMRVNMDGSVDDAFQPATTGPRTDGFGSSIVSHLAVQADGRIVIGGFFNRLGGVSRHDIGRLLPDGALDPTFDAGSALSEFDTSLRALAVEANGDILLGGLFSLRDGGPRRALVRLRGSNPDFLGRFEFRASPIQVWETNGAVRLTVHRHGGAPGPASVRLLVRGGTASNGVDFALASEVLPFAAGEASQTVTVTVLPDQLVEPPEEFTLTLTDPIAAILGSQKSVTVRILDHPGGLPDESFAIGSGPDNWVGELAWLPGEKFLARGQFFRVNGVERRSLARFHPDGSFDAGFDARLDSDVISFAPISDGKVYVCSGIGRNVQLTRRLADGSLDPEFQTQYETHATEMLVQADGKLVFNRFTETFSPFPGTRSNHLVRVHANGSPDTNFNAALTVEGNGIHLLQLQADGKILVGGAFTNLGGVARSGLARLHPDGSVDLSFAPAVPEFTFGTLALQADGRILLGGTFTNIGGHPARLLARLLPDGAFDPSFGAPFDAQPPGAGDATREIVVQSDGRILVNGRFSISNRTTGPVLRLQSNGALDRSFDPEFGFGAVSSLLLQADGKVIAGGSFDEVGDTPRRFLARLLNDEGLGAGRIEFNTSAVEFHETNSTVLLTVRRTGASRGAVSVNYGAGGGNATAGEDFSLPNDVIRFEDGDTVPKTITLQLHNDLRAEGRETFSVYLVNPLGGATLGEPAVVAVTVLDDDTELEFESATQFVHEHEPVKYISVRRLGGTNGEVSVHFATRNGTAQADMDYLGQDCTLTFADGQTNHVFGLPILEDDETESDETLDLVLSAPTGGARLGTNTMARLVILDNERPGTLDAGFDARNALNPIFTFNGPIRMVEAVTVEPQGRILVAGLFGDPTGGEAVGLLRLMPDGALDWSFAAGGSSNGVRVLRSAHLLARQPDGKVLVASDSFPPRLHRFFEDGWLDESFHAVFEGEEIRALTLDSDGRILVGGSFSRVNGIPRNGLALLEADGSLDSTFDPGEGTMFTFEGEEPLPGIVSAIQPQAGGSVLIGGLFTSIGPIRRNGLARLTAAGTLDASFDPGSGLTNELFGPGYATVSALVTQPDGRVLVAGNFTHVDGLARANLARLQFDGRVDASFDASATPALGSCFFGGADPIRALTLQSDGRVLVAGAMGDGAGCVLLLRLNADGSLDQTFDRVFDPFFFGFGHTVALQADGQILLGGNFNQINDQLFPGLARLNGGVAAFEFRSVSRLAGGRTRLTFAMPRGQNHVLQASSDLMHWTDLNSGRPLRNLTDYTDTTAAGADRHFYRARKTQ